MHLKAKEISVLFGQVRALQGVSLAARPGEVVALFGANGSGKTTFLKAVAGLVPVSSGRITYHGEDITSLPAHERVARGVHYVSDRARVALRMNVRENLDVGGYLRKPAEMGEARERVYDLFPVLREKAQSPAGILSGGERQMLVIGRALMGNPSLLLLDEPFLGLSLEVRDRILSVIDGELRGKMTILLAENDPGAAFRILDRYCILLNGERIHEETRSESDTEERLRAAFRRLYQRAPGGYGGGENR
ncbi:MAG: ABC transporter ATP-binding protein [Deltaproteobacteria bacterium]|nr:ABC transporter ATP-binding protein [Deltaproteobacteria bacterium]MDH3382697.1 ABC transporter ATP-binding protein [Deltaproteobacteria bacterium]